jgi:hypothetical protein
MVRGPAKGPPIKCGFNLRLIEAALGSAPSADYLFGDRTQLTHAGLRSYWLLKIPLQLDANTAIKPYPAEVQERIVQWETANPNRCFHNGNIDVLSSALLHSLSTISQGLQRYFL